MVSSTAAATATTTASVASTATSAAGTAAAAGNVTAASAGTAGTMRGSATAASGTAGGRTSAGSYAPARGRHHGTATIEASRRGYKHSAVSTVEYTRRGSRGPCSRIDGLGPVREPGGRVIVLRALREGTQRLHRVPGNRGRRTFAPHR